MYEKYYSSLPICTSLASLKGIVGGCGLGGVWVHIKGSTCHVKDISVFKA